jgi:hypothetical protein
MTWEADMFNPIPSIFGKSYGVSADDNMKWATPEFRRHVETVNALGYVPAIVGLASLALGKDVVNEVENFLKKEF